MVNQERTTRGLNALTMPDVLREASRARAREVAVYFSHTRPNGQTCFTILGEYGITYMRAGENIASGQRSPKQVVEAWMNSQGHRENILKTDVNKLGVGFYQYNWVQLFTD